jgi:HAD superfamily hydrolase (TIGR01484 family)
VPFLQDQDLLGIEGLFTDVDDTLTKDGKLSAQTYLALWQLREAGIPVIPVTGRSYGWAHMMLSQWPVDGVIAESGGVYLYRDMPLHGLPEPHSKTQAAIWSPLKMVYFDAIEKVAGNRQRLMARCEQILKDYPQLRFANDNVLRQVDVAIDYCEDIPRVPIEIVQKVIQSLRDSGFQARHSTVHINAWHGSFDKGPMALRYLQEARGVSSLEAQERWAFIGDAPNDSSMFALFARSFAVANIEAFLPAMNNAKPARLTRASHGAGFVEFAQLLLSAIQQKK